MSGKRMGRAEGDFATCCNSREESDGITVTATMRENVTDTEIATAMLRNSCATSRSRIRIGIKAIAVVGTETGTAAQT